MHIYIHTYIYTHTYKHICIHPGHPSLLHAIVANREPRISCNKTSPPRLDVKINIPAPPPPGFSALGFGAPKHVGVLSNVAFPRRGQNKKHTRSLAV